MSVTLAIDQHLMPCVKCARKATLCALVKETFARTTGHAGLLRYHWCCGLPDVMMTGQQGGTGASTQ